MKRRNAQRLVRSIKASGATIFASQVADEFELRGVGLVTENHVIEYMRRLLSALSDAPAPQEAAPGEDDPEFDATDAAHPAWWRGNDRGVESTCEALNRMLDHPEKPIGFAYDPLHTLAKRIRALTATSLPPILCGACGSVLDVRRVDGRYLATGYCPACPDPASPALRMPAQAFGDGTSGGALSVFARGWNGHAKEIRRLNPNVALVEEVLASDRQYWGNIRELNDCITVLDELRKRGVIPETCIAPPASAPEKCKRCGGHPHPPSSHCDGMPYAPTSAPEGDRA